MIDPKLRKSCQRLRALEAKVRLPKAGERKSAEYENALAYRRELYQEFGARTVQAALQEISA